MRRVALPILCLLATCASLSRADEGRIPIAAPATLTSPGHYVLTRNIQVLSGDAITIDATHVTLDLNGHTISSTSGAGFLIHLMPSADLITIRNGRLSGGQSAIFAASSVGLTIWMESLEVRGSSDFGIALDGVAHVELMHSGIRSAVGGIVVQGSGFSTGRYVGNTFEDLRDGLRLVDPRDAQVRDNNLIRCTGQGITLGLGAIGSLGGNLVEGNVISGSDVGIYVDSAVVGNQIVGNALWNNSVAVWAELSSSNRIAHNVIHASTSTNPCGAGLCIKGPRNLVERNLVQGSTAGCGISFFGGQATANAYRNNSLRDNAGGGVCITNGASATDGGGNVL